MHNNNMFSEFKICMVAPGSKRLGGMAIQADLMTKYLEESGATIYKVDTIIHSLLNKFLIALRIILQPLVLTTRLFKQAYKCNIIHVHGCSWFGFVPVIVCSILNRLFFKKIFVISFHGGKGHIWIKKHGWYAIPIMKQADKIIVVSKSLEIAFKEKYLNCILLKNIVDSNKFIFKERNTIKPTFVWIRALEDVYNPMLALKTFKLISNDYPDAKITFIGDGSLRNSLEIYVEKNNVKNVVFTGRLPNEELPKYYNNADIMLNTSKNDGLPTILLEASAAGLIIITTKVGGIPDIIENEQNGIMIENADENNLAEAIIKVLSNSEEAHSINLSAKSNAKLYSWPEVSKMLFDIYSKCLNKNAINEES